MRQVQRVVDLLEELRDTTASIYFVPDIFVVDLIQSRTAEIHGVPIVAMCETPFQGSSGLVKRGMDIVISSVALIVLSPFFVLIALAHQADFPGTRDLPAAALRPGRPGDRRAQVQDHESHRGRPGRAAGNAGG